LRSPDRGHCSRALRLDEASEAEARNASPDCLSCHNRHARPWPTVLPLLVVGDEYVRAGQQSEPILTALTDSGRCDHHHRFWKDARPRLFGLRALKHDNGSRRIPRRSLRGRAYAGLNATDDDPITSRHDGRRRRWHSSRRLGRRLGLLAAYGDDRQRRSQGKTRDS
jgi:hypothetical protein